MIRWFTQAFWVRAWRTLTHDTTWSPPEAAEAPDPVDEHFTSAPRVIAGSDIDRQKSIEQTRVDIVFGGIVADTLADLDAHLSAYYVTPETNS